MLLFDRSFGFGSKYYFPTRVKDTDAESITVKVNEIKA